MGKEELNHKILKAIAIGISVSIVIQPVIVLAEGEEDTNNDSLKLTVEASTTEEAPTSTATDVEKANTEYSEQVKTADTAVVEVSDDVYAVKKEQGNVNSAEDYVNKGVPEEEKKNFPNGTVIENTYNELVSNEIILNGDQAKIEGEVEEFSQKSEAADKAVGSLQDAVDNMETMANDAKNAVDKAEEAITGAQQEIKNARIKDTANLVYKAADDAVNAANVILAAAEKKYASKKQEYEAALLAAEQAEAEFNNAIDTVGSDVAVAEINMKSAREKAEKLKQQAEEAFNALVNAQGRINLKGLKDEADSAIKAQRLADQAVEEKNTEIDELAQVALDADNKLKIAISDKNDADQALLDAHDELDEISAVFNKDQYDAADALEKIGALAGVDDDHENKEKAELAKDLIMIYAYTEIFKDNSSAKFSTLSFSEWIENSEGVQYINVSYTDKKSKKNVTKYFVYNVEDGKVVILELFTIPVGNGNDNDVIFGSLANQVYCEDDYYDEINNSRINQNCTAFVQGNKENKEKYTAAELKLSDAELKAETASKAYNKANEDNEAAKEVLLTAKGEFEKLKEYVTTAAITASTAQEKYNDALVADSKLSSAKTAYENLLDAAKEADYELNIASNKLTALQNTINGLKKQMLIGDEFVDINVFTSRIEGLKKDFEDAKEIYEYAAAKKISIEDLKNRLTGQLNDKLIEIETRSTEGATSGEFTHVAPSSDIVYSGTTEMALTTSENQAVVITEKNVALVATANETATPDGQVLGASREYNEITVKPNETVDKTENVNKNSSNLETKKTDDKKTNDGNKTTTKIIEPAVPLVGSSVEEAKEFNPLWLIFMGVAAVGVTVEELIRRLMKNTNVKNK